MMSHFYAVEIDHSVFYIIFSRNCVVHINYDAIISSSFCVIMEDWEVLFQMQHATKDLE